MSWNPRNRFQQAGGYNNQFQPRPHFAPRPRFESRFRGPDPNFSGPRNFPSYGPRAVGSYRTSRPFHSQSRPFRPHTTRTPVPSSDGIKSESQSTKNKDKEEKTKQNEEQKEKASEPTVNQNDSEKSDTVKVDDPETTREDANLKEPVAVSQDTKSGQLDDSKTEQQDDKDMRTSGNTLVTEQKEQLPDTSADNDKVITENKRTEFCEDTDMRVKIATETEQSAQGKESDKSVRDENKSTDDSMPKDTDKNEPKNRRNDADDDDDDSSDEDTGFCKYCQKSFSSTTAYYTHTRGLIHINLYMKAKEEKQVQITVSANSERIKESDKAQDVKQLLSAEETKEKSEQQNKQLSGASRVSKTFSGQDQDKEETQNESKTEQFAHSNRSEFISSEERRPQVEKSDKSWAEIADRLISETGLNSKQKQNFERVDNRRLSSGPNYGQRFEKRSISRQTYKQVEDSRFGQFGLALSDVGSGSGDDDEHKLGQFDSVPDLKQNYERGKTNYGPVEKYIDKADREKVQIFGSVHDPSYVKETDRNVYGECSEGKDIGQFYGNEGQADSSQHYNYDSHHVEFKQTNSYIGQSHGQGSSYPGQMQEHSNTYPQLGRGQSQRYPGRGRGKGGSYQDQGSRYPDLSGRQATSYKGRDRGQGISNPGQGDRFTDGFHGQDSSYQGKGYQQGESYQREDFEQEKYGQAVSYTRNNYEKGDSYRDTYRKEGFDEGESYVSKHEQDDYQSGINYEQGCRYSEKEYNEDKNYEADISEQDNNNQGDSYEQNSSYQEEGYEEGEGFKDGNIDNVHGDYSGGDYNDAQDDYNNYENSGPTDGQGDYNNKQEDFYNDGNDDPYYGQGDYYDGQDDYYNEQGEHNDGQGYSDRGQFYAIAGYKTKQGTKFREEEVTNIEAADDDDDEEEEEDEDTSYCKYCKLPFSSSVAYHAHTRGLQHTTLIMEEKRKKGDQRFRKETVAPEVLKVEIPKPQQPQPTVNPEDPDIPDDYDFETNWMNLDDELIKRLQKKKASDRDLTPDDIGKKQFSDDFSCALCNVQCTSALTFKMHIEGKQHKNNLDRLESGSAVKKKKTPGVVFTSVEGDDVEPQFNAQIANYTENALMGLEFLTEFQKPDPKAPCRYVCNLCEAKCDSSTVLAHIIGVKHKLCYFREKHFKLYEHLTKYTSKKKRSEMNENLEDFARQIEAEEGRGKVRVKIELEAGSGEENLNEIMTRMSKALKEKMVEIGKESEVPSKPLESKKGQFALPKEVFQKTEKKQMKLPPKATEGPRAALVRKERLPPPVGHRYAPPPRPPPPLPQRSYFDSPHDPYRAESYRSGSYGREDRAELYSRDRLAYRRDTFEYERECDYLDMMLDTYRYSDPFLERRRLEDLIEKQRRLRELESRRLDDLLLDRHRLVDPTLETRRLEDILQRKRKIEEAEKLRFEDIMRRKRLLEENDIEKLRIQRYEKLMKTSQEQDVTAAREVDRPSLEELIARRRIKNLAAAQENRPLADASLLPNSYSASVAAQSAVPQSNPLYHQPQIAPNPVSVQASGPVTVPTVQNLVQAATAVGMQGTSQVVPGIGAHGLSQVVTGPRTHWAGQGSTGLVGQEPSQIVSGLGLQGPSQIATTPGGASQQPASGALSTAQKVVANKELQEELAKNPGVNIGELLGNLSSSMIATEDDAAMALQISNTLTQALLKFRLQHATKQLSEEVSPSKKSESKSIPGLGSSATDTGKSVPSFLRSATSTLSPKVQTPTSVTKSSVSREAHFSPQNTSVSVTDSKKVGQLPQGASQPQTDLLKSIREQAQQLQAQISSRAKTSTSVSQSGIQTQSQFVHGQTSNISHTPPSSAHRQIYVSGKKSSQEPKDTASPSQSKSAWERQIYISGKKTNSVSQDTASSVSQTTSSTDRHVYLSGKKSIGGSQDVDMSQTTPPMERHVYLSGTKTSLGSQETAGPSQMAPSTGNPVIQVPYDQWYNTMYGQNMYSYYPVPAPPVPLGVPPPPPPSSENT